MLFCATLLFSVGAAGEQFQVLLDTNNNPSSGCDVQTIDGPFQGVERILTTQFSGGSVTGVTLRNCINPATGTFGPPQQVSAGGWPVALGLGPNGANAVETFVPISSLSIPEGRVRLGFASRDANGDADAVTQSGQGFALAVPQSSPQAIPSLSLLALILLSTFLALVVWRRYPHAISVVLVLFLGLFRLVWVGGVGTRPPGP